jgi:hypothetical protein
MATHDNNMDKAYPAENIEHGDIGPVTTRQEDPKAERDLLHHQLKSDQDQLSAWKTVWRFRKVSGGRVARVFGIATDISGGHY